MQIAKKILLILATAGCLSACAVTQNTGKVEHGIDVMNRGESIVSEVWVQYGDLRRVFCERGCGKGGGSMYGVNMPVQEEMFITWKTSDGIKQEAHVLVKSKIVDLSRFRRLFIEFNGSNLRVNQGSHYSNPSMVGWEQAELYP
jgi:hypothetical protein